VNGFESVEKTLEELHVILAALRARADFCSFPPASARMKRAVAELEAAELLLKGAR
jgi:hypothetical protein